MKRGSKKQYKNKKQDVNSQQLSAFVVISLVYFLFVTKGAQFNLSIAKQKLVVFYFSLHTQKNKPQTHSVFLCYCRTKQLRVHYASFAREKVHSLIVHSSDLGLFEAKSK